LQNSVENSALKNAEIINHTAPAALNVQTEI